MAEEDSSCNSTSSTMPTRLSSSSNIESEPPTEERLAQTTRQSQESSDVKERKRLNNRIAQRTYRRNQKERMKALEQALKRSTADGLLSPISYIDPPLSISQDEILFEDQFNWQIPSLESTTDSINDVESLDLVLSSPEPLASSKTKTEGITSLTSNLTSENGFTMRRTALHVAVSNGNAAIVGLLIRKGADVTHQDSEGKTALHLAVEQGNEAIINILSQDIVSANVKDSMGRTALFPAIGAGNEVVTKLLLDAHVDCNERDLVGNVALHWAVERDSESLTCLLLKYGADING